MNVLFRYSFELRKPCPLFGTLMSCFENLSNRGFDAVISFPEGEDARWMEFRTFEKSAVHSTLVVSRMLATPPTKEERNAVSIFNFGLAYGSPLKIRVAPDNKFFEVLLFEPKKEQKKRMLLAQMSLLGFEEEPEA